MAVSEVRHKTGDTSVRSRRDGKGERVLFLHGAGGWPAWGSFMESLAGKHDVLMPEHPGFGLSDNPPWIRNVGDVAMYYLDFLDALDGPPVHLIGHSLGGWIALEMAAKDDSFLSHLVLVDPYGVKIGGPTDRDIEDVWTIHPAKATALKWFDPEKGKRDFAAMSEEALTVIARNSESFARLCWDPCLHNPKLKHRLHRVHVPTLFVWGENDGIVTPDYGRAFSAMVPGAEFAVVGSAGHYPHLEQPAAFLGLARKFLA